MIKQEQGSAAARVLLAPTAAAATPGLLDGYGFNQIIQSRQRQRRGFGQVEWSVTDRLRLLPGLRFNYDKKDGSFDQQVYGGLQTTDPALIALQRSVLAPLTYAADIDDTNVSGQITARLQGDAERQHLRAPIRPASSRSASTSMAFRSMTLGDPILSTAAVKPEDTHHFEAGVKTQLGRNVTVNVTGYNTDDQGFPGDGRSTATSASRAATSPTPRRPACAASRSTAARASTGTSRSTARLAYTDAIYVSFPDAPPPFEETGGPTSKDISGAILPGVSKWSGSFGGEFSHAGVVHRPAGQFFAAADISARTSFSSNATPSKYLMIDGYSLVNPRVGFRFTNGLTLSVWSRNLFNKDYYELMSTPSGNTGLYVGQPGDPRTFGVTLRLNFKSRYRELDHHQMDRSLGLLRRRAGAADTEPARRPR